MNHIYRLFFVFLGLLSYSMHANVRPIKSHSELKTYVLKPSRGSIIHATIEDIDPRTDFSGALPALDKISRLPELAGVGFLSVNINKVPEVFIWLSQEGHHIAEWPAFIFVENGKVQAIETKIHGDSLKENIKAGIKKHFSARPASSKPISSVNKHKQQPTERRSKRRRRNGRSHMPCK